MPGSVGVVGAGRIGGQCIRILADAGLAPVTVDLGDRFDALADCSFILEAVPESLEVKRRVLSAIAAVAPLAVVGTTSSSLSVSALAHELNDPNALLAFHPFSPMSHLRLVEIGVTPTTPRASIGLALQVAAAMQRTVLLTPEGAGLVVNRLLKRWTHCGLRAVEHGLTPHDVERLFVERGWPMGPLSVVELVGPSTSLAVSRNLERAHGARFCPPRLLERWVDQGLTVATLPAPTQRPGTCDPDEVMHTLRLELRDEYARLIREQRLDPEAALAPLLKAAAGWPADVTRSVWPGE